MSDHIDHIISGIAVLLSLLGFGLGLRKHDSKKKEAELLAWRMLGLSYARAAWAVVRYRNTAPGAVRGALLDAFRLADTALDGRRDFTDAQASSFLDEVAAEDAAAANNPNGNIR